MRLLLNLKALKSVKQNKLNNSKYYTGMHGWIYSKLKGTKFGDLHSKREFKPFCFGNLYPIRSGTIKQDDVYRFWISSPDEMFMVSLLSNLSRTKN